MINCKFPVFSPSLSPSPVRPISPPVMVNWQNPVTITHEISALAPPLFRFFFLFLQWFPVGALVKLLHVVDGIYLCACFHFGPAAAGAYDRLPVVGSSFVTLASSGAWLGVGVNGDGPLL